LEPITAPFGEGVAEASLHSGLNEQRDVDLKSYPATPLGG